MDYGEPITRAFWITWRHRYLWLLAVLGGADVGGSGYGANYFGNGFGNGLGRLGSGNPQQVAQFVQDNLALILVLVAGLGLLAVLVWLALSSVTTGALVRASAEHDAERPFGLGLAWRTGVGTFWSILGLRLLGLLWGLLALSVIAFFVGLGIVFAVADRPGPLAAAVALGILVVLALIPVWILVGLAFILGTRGVVLEQRGTIAGLRRGFQLLRTRLGRVLLVWLIQVAIAIGAGVVVVLPLLVVFFAAVVLVAGAAFAGGAAAAIAVGVLLGIVALAGIVVLNAIIGTYFSTYWTVAFRRLELEAPRPVAWPPPAYPPQLAG